MQDLSNYQQLSIEQLVSFTNHPFALYEGQRFNDMVESIRANGILTPIVVRAIADGKFEILSGHNRVNAAREAGLESVPAVVLEDVSDDDARLIVTEANLLQRSFADMAHSERAAALATPYDAMKKKSGYRSDLLEEIDELTCGQIDHRLKTRDKLGMKYGMSGKTVSRYLQVSKLIEPLKERLDSRKFTMQVAENLSFVPEQGQTAINETLGDKRKLTIKQAVALREKMLMECGNYHEIAEDVLNSDVVPVNRKPVKIKREVFAQYFDDSKTDEEIEAEITEILKAHFNR